MKRADGTQGFVLNQTMLRVRDPDVSVAFYRDVLGMTLLQRIDMAEMRFSVYFLAYLADQEAIASDPAERAQQIFGRETTLELTHNWGSEDDPAFSGYHDGNTEPRGFGHIGIGVPDLQAACDRFEVLGVAFKKRPHEGKMSNIAFILDPDGYWIEIFSAKDMVQALRLQGTPGEPR